MAESKAPGKAQKADPTVTSSAANGGDDKEKGYPKGTHPIHPIADQDWGPHRFTYSDNPDKPDPSSVAQVVDPADGPSITETEEEE